MSACPLDPDERPTAQAARELARLKAQIEEARAELVRLQQAVIDAECRLGRNLAADIVDANERLVSAALQARLDAETAARALADAARSARLDALTGLPNRVLLLDRFAHSIANANRRGSRLALLFVDLDNFKQINDSHGHAFGDEVLTLAARCLASTVREVDTVSRHGGDEFLILLDEVAQPSDAVKVADKLIGELALPHQVNDYELSLTASIGISLYPDDGDDADTLIKRADAAMYRAKRQGRGSFCFHGDPPVSEGDSMARPPNDA
ncbi:MAG: diguanylate cyclase domain-containing protein [Lysobacter sp.]